MPRQAQPAPFDGALVIDKPQGKTSHDVVDAVRHFVGFRQVGHLGTLDPLGTGVLVLLLGRATRLVQFYAGRRKRYTAGFRITSVSRSRTTTGWRTLLRQGPIFSSCLPIMNRAVSRRFTVCVTALCLL